MTLREAPDGLANCLCGSVDPPPSSRMFRGTHGDIPVLKQEVVGDGCTASQQHGMAVSAGGSLLGSGLAIEADPEAVGVRCRSFRVSTASEIHPDDLAIQREGIDTNYSRKQRRGGDLSPGSLPPADQSGLVRFLMSCSRGLLVDGSGFGKHGMVPPPPP